MTRNKILIGFLSTFVLLVLLAGYLLSRKQGGNSRLLTVEVIRREIKAVISTNGVIEPIDRADVFAPFDGFITLLSHREGEDVAEGELLFRMESDQLATALASAKAALLQARRQAQTVLAGPPKEELAGVKSSMIETELQLKNGRQDLLREESLLKHDATTRINVEKLRERVKLLEIRLDGLIEKKQQLLNRYTSEEKDWESKKVNELSRQVEVLTRQMESGSIRAPRKGRLYSLNAKSQAYVNRGQLLAQLYQPGQVRVKAYVDEPDLGRIAMGQDIEVEWDGLPEKRWAARVEQLAQQVLAMGNRSVGFVFCSIEGDSKELLPNVNVKIQIVTAKKSGALVVPRSAVLYRNGQSTVMLLIENQTVFRPVVLGMVTPLEAEILQGLEPGARVAVSPGEAPGE